MALSPGDRPSTVDVAVAPVGSMFLRVVRLHRLVGTELLGAIGLVPPQELIVLHLRDRGGTDVPQRDLVSFLGRDRSTVTNTLQAMERSGWIERRPSTLDRRALLVSLSADGLATVARIESAWAELEQITLDGLTERQQRHFGDALGTVEARLLDALESARRSSREIDV